MTAHLSEFEVRRAYRLAASAEAIAAIVASLQHVTPRLTLDVQEHRTICVLSVAGANFSECVCGMTWETFDGVDVGCPIEAAEREHARQRLALADTQADWIRRLRACGMRDADLMARLTRGEA